MSAGSNSRMAWLEQNYEKIAVLAVLVGLLLSAAVLVIRIRQGHRRLADTTREIPADQQAPISRVSLRRIEQAEAQLANPVLSATVDQSMWTSEIRVHCIECQKPIRYEAERCPFCGADQPEVERLPPEQRSRAGDGIPDVWKLQHGLDPLDPYLHLRDVDGDGFTVLEEYRAGTSPVDPGDSPPPVMKLRLDSTRSIPFKFRFLAVQEIIEGEQRFQMNVRTLDRTYFARIGDTIEGYLVESYNPETRTVYLVINDRRIPLRQGQVQEETERELRLRSLLDGTRIETRVGQSFEIRGATYQVLSHQPEGVRVKEVGGDESVFMIGRISEAERAALERGPEQFGPMGDGPEEEGAALRFYRTRPAQERPGPLFRDERPLLIE